MSALAHPGPIVAGALPLPRRRHMTLVPAPQPERDAEVIRFPVPARPVAAPRTAAADVPLRLTARGWRVLVALLLAVCAALGAVVGSAVSATSEPTGVEVVTVRTGDSLWSIASEIAAPGTDVRDVVSQIAALNDLDGTVVVAGQQLTVPGAD